MQGLWEHATGQLTKQTKFRMHANLSKFGGQALTSYCQNKLDRANYVAKLENKWMDLDFVFSILFDLANKHK